MNLIRKTTLSTTVVEAKTVKQKTFGLTLSPKPYALRLNTHFGIHTFFMMYPIDVIILDNNNIVVSLKEHLNPNRIYLWNPKHSTVLELPSGTIKKSKTEIEDLLKIS